MSISILKKLKVLTKEDSDVLHSWHHGLERPELHLLDDILLISGVPVLDKPLQDVILGPQVSWHIPLITNVHDSGLTFI